MVKDIINDIQLYFTNRSYFEQRRRYKKLQRKARKKLKALVNHFCPWSGAYMHDIIRLMLDFYAEVYTSRDCCFSNEGHLEEVATSLNVALAYAEKIDEVDKLSDEELLNIVKDDAIFDEYVSTWEKKANARVTDSNNKEALFGSLANAYLTEKFTKAMYKIIGEHIWNWWD